MENHTINDATRVVEAAAQQGAQAAADFSNWSVQASLDGARRVVQASTEATRWVAEGLVDGNRHTIQAATDATNLVNQAAANGASQILAGWSSNTRPPLKTMFELQKSAVASWQTLAEAAVRNNGALLHTVQTAAIRQVGTAVQDLQRSAFRAVEDAVRQGQNVVSEINGRNTKDR